jgi:hypothetical protein
MNNHTPGPWEFDKETWTIRVKEWEHNTQMGDYRGCIVASFDEAHGNREHAFDEAEANARLIAAAPEMYEALKTLKQDINTALLYKRIGKRTATDMEATINNVLAKIEA